MADTPNNKTLQLGTTLLQLALGHHRASRALLGSEYLPGLRPYIGILSGEWFGHG